MAEGYEPKYRGAWTHVRIYNNDDLDNCTNYETYYEVPSGSTAAHSPGDGYTVICIPGGWGPIQIAFNYILNDIRIRVCFSSWRPWKRITVSDLS